MKKKFTLLKFSISLWLACQSIMVSAQGGLTSPDLAKNMAQRSSIFGSWTGLRSASISEFLANIIQLVLALIGVIFTCLMVYGGYLWLTARGNEEYVQKAKKTITSSLWGLIIVIGAYVVAYFLISQLAGGGGYRFTAE